MMKQNPINLIHYFKTTHFQPPIEKMFTMSPFHEKKFRRRTDSNDWGDIEPTQPLIKQVAHKKWSLNDFELG